VIRIHPRVIRGLLAGAALLGFASAVIAMSGGGATKIGGLLIRSHNPYRPAVAAFVLAVAAFAGGTIAVRNALEWWWSAIERHAAKVALVAAAAALAVGIAWGTFVAGGSDSYCYLNTAELFSRGTIRDYEPLATDPGWPGNAWSFAPTGHRPASNRPGFYVPICASGYPFVLAAARMTFGRTAMFWVTPIMGALAVYLAFLLARRAAGGEAGNAAGVLAALLTASSPIVLYQIVQPMTDVPATAMWSAVLWIASSSRHRDATRAVLAGAVCGFAVTIRPNLVPLAGVVALGVAFLPRERTLVQRFTALVAFGLATLPGVLVVMALQRAMHGSPLASGYGSLSALFAASNLIPNLQRYPRWLIETHTPLIAAALAAPFVLPRESRRYAVWLLAFAAATFVCYLFYVVFDAWWYLRFVLPAILPLLALAAAVVASLLQRLRPAARLLVFCAIGVTIPTLYVQTGIRRDAFLMYYHEWRFRSAGEYVATLPKNAAIITSHQTGSVRFYSGRTTAGWGDIERGRLDVAVRFLQQKGLKPYLLFEEWEEKLFKDRFAGERLGALEWPPITEIDRYVRIYDPDDRDRFARGELIQTRRIHTTPR
jgi:hypothetical protein